MVSRSMSDKSCRWCTISFIFVSEACEMASISMMLSAESNNSRYRMPTN